MREREGERRVGKEKAKWRGAAEKTKWKGV